MASEHEQVEQELIDSMLEQLAETPLRRVTSSGYVIDETQRIFWAIDFIDKFAKARGLRGIDNAIHQDQVGQKEG